MARVAIKSGEKHWTKITAKRGKQTRAAWVCAIGGRKPGPTLALLAGQHGMEPTGPAILGGLADDLTPFQLSGNLLIVPLVYANAIRHGFECEPRPGKKRLLQSYGRWHNQCPYGADRNKCGRNMNRMWPGDSKGSVYSRLAAALWERVVLQADYVIDFHCWQDWSPPGVLTTSDEGVELGKWVGVPWIHHNGEDTPLGRTMLSRNVCLSGRVGITVEFTPQTRIVKDMAELGRSGIENVMKRLKILPGRAERTRPLYLMKGGRWEQVKAERDVLVLPLIKPGDWVRKNQPLARLVQIDKPSSASLLKAPFAGVVWSTMPSSAVRAGEPMMLLRDAKRLAK